MTADVRSPAEAAADMLPPAEAALVTADVRSPAEAAADMLPPAEAALVTADVRNGRRGPAFTVPAELSAAAPPEARGLARDGVRLLIAAPDGLRHVRFTDLPTALRPGDLVVVNTSDTEPAALDVHRADGTRSVLHVSGPVRDDEPDVYVVELRTPNGRRVTDAGAGERIHLPDGGTTTLQGTGIRLRRAHLPGLPDRLRAFGRPVSYSCVHDRWPRRDYRTVFATPSAEFGSAEIPSAGRPFSAAVLAGLRGRGVGVADVVLHTGVSSLDADEVPLPERYRVPVGTAAAVAATREAGGRVVAVGTTVTRALETVADATGTVRAGAGWTDLVLGPDRPARVVDGLVTGWHEPEASHLLLLEAVAGPRLVGRAYAEALRHRYLWHEFGDSCLLLPGRPVVRRLA